MMNGIELLIGLNIDKASAKANIQNYIKNLKTQDLDVTLNIIGSSSNDKIFTQMQKQIDELQSKVKELNKLLDNVGSGNSSGGRASKSITNLKHEQEQIRTWLKNNFKTETFDFKMNVDTSTGDKVLKGFIANIRDVDGEIKKISFDAEFKQLSTALKDDNLKSYKTSLEAVNKALDSSKNKALLSTKQIAEFQAKANNIKIDELDVNKSGSFKQLKQEIESTIASTKQFNNVTNDIKNAIVSIGRDGSVSAGRLDDMVSKVARINAQDITLDEKVVKLRRELNQLNKEFDDVSHNNKMDKAMSSAKKQVDDLESSLLKLINQNKRVTSSMDLSSYKRQLQELANVSKFTSQKDIDNYNKKLKEAQSSVRRLGAEIQEQNRNSMTMMQQMKIA